VFYPVQVRVVKNFTSALNVGVALGSWEAESFGTKSKHYEHNDTIKQTIR